MSKEKSKSMLANVILNMFNTFLTMAFSLLTFPYASRILQVSNIGKVNYSSSIVSYFALIAALGFNTYAIREGSKIKMNQKKLDEFSCQIFTFNFVMVVVAYVLLLLLIFFDKKFYPLSGLLLIQSITMINVWINVGWINIVFEDYIFITIRSIIVQVLSIVLLYLLVKTPNDYYIYASITIFSNTIVSILNYIHSKKYCRISFTKSINVKKHIKPILIFFSNTLAVSIYLNSDVTIIGYLLNSYQVGIYTAAVKVYSAIITLLSSIYNVTISRLSLYWSMNKQKKYKTLLNRIINSIILVSIPTTALLSTLAKEIMILISGKSYEEAQYPLSILAFAFLFAVLGGALAYCVEIPMGNEKKVLHATVISAMENIILNILLIPFLGICGSALTTLLAEITVFFVLFFGIKNKSVIFNYHEISNNTIKTIAATIPIFFIKYFVMYWNECSNFLVIFLTTTISLVVFSLMNIFERNIYFEILLRSMITKIKLKLR